MSAKTGKILFAEAANHADQSGAKMHRLSPRARDHGAKAAALTDSVEKVPDEIGVARYLSV